MADPRPTKNQWQAIRELNKHLSVSAGAGAGKTWVLTERYTTMLAGKPLVLPPLAEEAREAARPGDEPSRPSQIVAITFTKEAAGEMKARIRGRLGKWKREATERAASEAELRRIAQLKEEVERATITTIHGYCSELLREYPVEAGVDPHFRVLEESGARLWLDEAIREILDEGLTASEAAGSFESATSGGSVDAHTAAVVRLVSEYGYEPLVGHLTRFYPSVREQTEDFAEMGQRTLAALGSLSANLEPLVDRLETLLENISRIDLSKKDTSKASAKRAFEFQQAWPTIAQELQTWRADGFAYRAEIGALLQDLPKGWGVLIKELKEDVNPMKQLVAEMAGSMVPSGMLDAAQDVCALLERLHLRYTAKKDKERALDFTDLQNRAVRLLGVAAVSKRQAERLRFLMVDEFQDTNPVQKKLIDALGAGNPHLRLFVVGDAKQSIYRFRGADLQVFLDTQQEVQGKQGDHISLLENFRTQQPIIQFVNRLFARLMAPEAGGPAYEPMTPTRQPEHGNPMVEILHLLPAEDSAQSKLREAEAIARRIRQMVGTETLVPTAEGLRPVQYRDITLLFSAMSHVQTYEYALQKAGIPYYIVGSRHFFRRQEVKDLAMLLQAIVEGRDVLALIGALRSPLFGLSDEALYWLGREGLLAADWRETAHWSQIAADDRAKLSRAALFLQRWREQKSFLSAGDLLSGILEQTGYEQALLLTFGGTQKVGNVRKLLDIAYDQPAERAGVVPFLQYVQMMIEEGVDEEDAQVESDTSDVVKIMTVHKSKGLEFPVVILPDMAREFNTRTDGKFHYSDAYGLVMSFTEHDEWNEYGFASTFGEEEKRKAKEEERRKLYVAMTRARDYLLLVGTREEPKKPMSLDASRWFDWLVAAVADGQLSQMEASLQADWPEVKWTDASGSAEMGVVGAGVSAGAGVGANADAGMDAAAGADAFADETLRAGVTSSAGGVDLAATWNEIAAAGPGVEDEAAALLRQVHFPLLGALRPQAEQVPGILLSVSALMTFLTCPRQYFYKYEWKLPEHRPEQVQAEAEPAEWEPSRDGQPQDELDLLPSDEPAQERSLLSNSSHAATERGTLVHRVLEWVTRPEEADELIRRALAERSIVGEEAERWFPELKQNVETYLQSDLFREVQAAVSERSEMKFRLVFGKHEITGIVDKVIEKQNGVGVVIDYKTNRVVNEQTVRHYLPQLQLYTLVAKRLLNLAVERAVLYFTGFGREVQVPTSEAELTAMERQIENVCDHIALHDQVDDFPQAEEESPCKHCGFLLLCKGVTSL